MPTSAWATSDNDGLGGPVSLNGHANGVQPLSLVRCQWRLTVGCENKASTPNPPAYPGRFTPMLENTSSSLAQVPPADHTIRRRRFANDHQEH